MSLRAEIEWLGTTWDDDDDDDDDGRCEHYDGSTPCEHHPAPWSAEKVRDGCWHICDANGGHVREVIGDDAEEYAMRLARESMDRGYAQPADALEQPHVVECPRCGSEVYLEGIDWPDPADHEPGDVVSVWVSCYAQADGGGDPMGEFADAETCDEDILVGRLVLEGGTLGPCERQA